MTACRRVAIGMDDVLLREDIVQMAAVEIEHWRLDAVACRASGNADASR